MQRPPRSEAPWIPQRDDERRLRRIQAAVRLLDTAFEIPGTGWRFGLDGLIGLVPGVGDLVTTTLAAWILHEARVLGVRRRTLVRMGWNVAIDFLVGAVPLAGDVFDVVWKANVKNLELIERDLAKQGRWAGSPTRTSRSDLVDDSVLDDLSDDPDLVRGRPAAGHQPIQRISGTGLKPRVATAAIVGIVAAVASFMTGPVLGLILATVALTSGLLGLLIAVSPRRRGGLLSLAAIILGLVAMIRAVFVALF